MYSGGAIAAGRGNAQGRGPGGRRRQTVAPAIFSIATTYNLEGRRPEDSDILRIMRTVNPPVLRVPAGNTMNLWDWNTGMARTAEQLRQFGADPDARLNNGPSHGQHEYVRKMGGPMVAERWARLAKEGGSEPL